MLKRNPKIDTPYTNAEEKVIIPKTNRPKEVRGDTSACVRVVVIDK